MDQPRTVLILGGGVGGVVSARLLRKLLPKKDRILVIDRESEHLFQPSLLWLMIGDRKPEKISRPLDRLSRKGIEFICGEIEKINPQEKSLRVGGREIKGDALVISLGAEYAPDSIPGLAEGGHNLYTLEGSKEIYERLSRFEGGRIVLLTAAPMYKCPAAPYEAAMLLEYDCRRRKIRQKTQIDLYAAEPGPMGTAGPEVSAAVRKMVESRGISYHPNHQVTEVKFQERRVLFSNGLEANYDVLFYVPPHRPPKVVRDAGLVGESGWVSVDRHTLETSYPFVFAIGDVTAIPLKMGKPLPKAGVFAHGQAEVVAHNLAHQWTGKGDTKSFDGFGECFIEIGDHRAGMGSGNFYAEPTPQMELKKPGIRWHIEKVLFEKYWLRKWF